jgi:hypothetical protein
MLFVNDFAAAPAFALDDANVVAFKANQITSKVFVTISDAVIFDSKAITLMDVPDISLVISTNFPRRLASRPVAI